MTRYTISRSNANGGSYFTVFGRRFDTHEKAVEYAEAAIERREKLAGRRLDERALVRGVDHADDMDTRAKIKAKDWRPVVKEKQNPNRLAAEHAKLDGGKDSRKKLRARVEQAYLKRTGQLPEENVDAKRAKAVDWAEQHLERMLFDPSMPQSKVVEAEQILRQAKEGDLGHFKEMSQAVVAEFENSHAERLRLADAEREKAQTRLDSVKQLRPFDPTPQAPPPPPSTPPSTPEHVYIYMTDTAGKPKVVEWEGDTVVARHDPETNPEIMEKVVQ